MIGPLKKHRFLVVAAVLSWYGWSAAQPTPPVDEPPEVRAVPEIPELPGAPAGELEELVLEDPFRLARILRERAERDLAEETFLEATGGSATESEGGFEEAASAAPARSLVLSLDSTLVAGDQASAIVNGQRCDPGEAISFPGLEDPPIVKQIIGRTVKVEWRGRVFALDLIDHRKLVLVTDPAGNPVPQADSGAEADPAEEGVEAASWRLNSTRNP
ncbi:MAG: hypothetical protein D6702_01785 [Planctomycetota bacterium]|nr:MAG: hypothetical protein D6702_01785 [Planctomycetota bacterium]